ncbi:MAG TPA: dTDP-4-dehydrorhamnose reductase [Acidimicrobiales bacterium]|nr:dTDP-4-dehydrorhamnose reductase [Acidimicrobiales bacterium]
MSTRVLVTGASGQVGVDLTDALAGATPPGGDAGFAPDGRAVAPGEFDVVGLTHADLDVTSEVGVRAALAHHAPEVVVHLAAYTAVDRAEDEPDACFAVNATGTAVVAAGAAEIGAHLVAVSTDYVFAGDKGSAYAESDATGPLNVYGASKLAGEGASGDGATVVRTSWVMGVRGRTVLRAIVARALAGEDVRFVDDQTGTVTNAADLARALVTVVRERPGGLWHVADAGAATWFDVAAAAGAALGRDAGFATAIATRDLDPAPRARRPTRSDLDSSRFAAAFGPMPEWRDALGRLVAAMGRG